MKSALLQQSKENMAPPKSNAERKRLFRKRKHDNDPEFAKNESPKTSEILRKRRISKMNTNEKRNYAIAARD